MKNKMQLLNRLLIMIFLFCCIDSVTFAADGYLTLPTGERVSAKNGPVVFQQHRINGETEFIQLNKPPETRKIIVQFKGQPTAIQKKGKVLGAMASIEVEHAAFRVELEKLINNINKMNSAASESAIRREYYRAFNGVAMSADMELIHQIRKLPMVKSISPDLEASVNLDTSLVQIGADRVQQELGLTGKGVLVGVVDTGIDYRHAALGDGFGPGYRVVGGYDFYNEDADPRDGHGHGTHVAGIIGAGSDSLLGVAPEVTFLAVKVLSDGGSGEVSTIIAGIDYCLDPDGNPLTDDAVDIINMSLGAQPLPDSPLDIAVNNAYGAGVLCVVAAGNSGRENVFQKSYGTIGSPGTAEHALTVGAVNSANEAAGFTSKGPDTIHGAIKPEISAPGVNIKSSITENGTARWSGTSMATPHVTGAAALLKQQHPEWGPDQLKWCLVNSAQNSPVNDASIYVYGNGILDAWQAAHTEVIASPGVLSFGRVDLTAPVWQDTVVFKLKNMAETPRTVQLQTRYDLPNGAVLTISETNFLLTPNEEKSITAVISVDESVPTLRSYPFAYSGNVLCIAEADTINLPFGFIKANMLVIQFAQPPAENLSPVIYTPDSVFHERVTTNPLVQRYQIPLPADNYNLLAFIEEASEENSKTDLFIIEKQNLNVKGLTWVLVSKDDASFHAFPNYILDYSNMPILDNFYKILNFSLFRKTEKASSTYSFLFFWNDSDFGEIFFSELNNHYSITEMFLGGVQPPVATCLHHTGALTNETQLIVPSGSENLTPINAHFSFSNRSLWEKSANVQVYYQKLKSHSGTSMREGFWYDLELGETEAAKVFLGKTFCQFYEYTDDHNRLENVGYTLNVTEKNVSNPDVFQRSGANSSGLEINNDGSFSSFEFVGYGKTSVEKIVYETFQPGDTIYVESISDGILIPVYDVYDWADNSMVVSDFYRNTESGVINTAGQYNPFLSFSRDSTEAKDLYFHLYGKNTKIPESDKAVLWLSQFDEPNVGLNRLVVETRPYSLLGQTGHSVMDNAIHFTPESYLAPSVGVFQILADNKLTKWVKPGQDGFVRMIVNNMGHKIKNVRIDLLPASGERIPLEMTTLAPNEFHGALPKDLPHEFLDAVVQVEVDDGNDFELSVSPACFFGNSLDERQFDSRIYMRSYELTNLHHNGDFLDYELTLANTGNMPARDIEVFLPENDFFVPTNSVPVVVDSLPAGAEISVPIQLKRISRFTEPVYYQPVFNWSSGGKSYSRTYKILIDSEAQIANVQNDDSLIPDKFKLYRNYPNPFNPATTLKYDLNLPTEVKIVIFDILGRKVKVLLDEKQPAGQHQVMWHGKNNQGMPVSTGLYFCTIRTDMGILTQKLLLIQ